MKSWNDPRTGELTRLQLALATFALQLDAFELQTDDLLRSISHSRDHRFGDDARRGREFAEGGEIASQ